MTMLELSLFLGRLRRHGRLGVALIFGRHANTVTAANLSNLTAIFGEGMNKSLVTCFCVTSMFCFHPFPSASLHTLNKMSMFTYREYAKKIAVSVDHRGHVFFSNVKYRAVGNVLSLTDARPKTLDT